MDRQLYCAIFQVVHVNIPFATSLKKIQLLFYSVCTARGKVQNSLIVLKYMFLFSTDRDKFPKRL